MRAYLTLVRREVGTFFVSMTGYAIIASVLLLLGFSFTDMLAKLNDDPHGAQAPMTELFYSTFYFWLILLLTAPVITMQRTARSSSASRVAWKSSRPSTRLRAL